MTGNQTYRNRTIGAPLSAADWCTDAPPRNKSTPGVLLICRGHSEAAVASSLLSEMTGDAMSNEPQDNKVVVLADRAHLLPVTRLVSRPSVRIIDGRLAAVLELTRSAA